MADRAHHVWAWIRMTTRFVVVALVVLFVSGALIYWSLGTFRHWIFVPWLLGYILAMGAYGDVLKARYLAAA